MGCSLFFRHVSKFLMGLLPHKSPCVDCGNGQWNEQASSLYSGNHECYSFVVVILCSHSDLSSSRIEKKTIVHKMVYCLYLHSNSARDGEERTDMPT